uniref:PHD-type domain-containing protein n=1 Tax=Glossina palpalis gambiensis TaxID=67801 RepID=A0A1B0AMH2_9MUSC
MATDMQENFCNLCRQTSCIEGDDVILFGKWLTKHDLTVHYYCLLLSTYLPQKGTSDTAGLLGFLLRDIRREIVAAAKRICIYCSKSNASIHCRSCKVCFHLICGNANRCISHFMGDFHSYCDSCFPLDDVQKALSISKPLSKQTRCYICAQYMFAYHPKNWLYAPCCKNGFVHNLCMQKYALNAGYYLKCLWCKNVEFRNAVKLQGIFVPDCEASWETEPNAYQDLRMRHKRCDMKNCNCPRGRDYIQKPKWSLILCNLCGSFGAHNPTCIPGFEDSKKKVNKFTCDTCFKATKEIHNVGKTKDCRGSQEMFGERLDFSESISPIVWASASSNQQLNRDGDNNAYVDKRGDCQGLEETLDFPENTSSVVWASASFNQLPNRDMDYNLHVAEARDCHGPQEMLRERLDFPESISSSAVLATTSPNQLLDSINDEIIERNLNEFPTDENFVKLEMYEFTKSLLCLDKVAVKLKPSDPRFAGKTVEDIKRSSDLITADDISERLGDLSILEQFDEIIDQNL